MSQEFQQAKKDHIDAMHDLMQYLIETCGDRFTPDLSRALMRILQTFDACCAKTPCERASREGLRDYALGRNYLTGQCAVLLAFAHEIILLAGSEQGRPLNDAVRRMCDRANGNHDRFFQQKLFNTL